MTLVDQSALIRKHAKQHSEAYPLNVCFGLGGRFPAGHAPFKRELFEERGMVDLPRSQRRPRLLSHDRSDEVSASRSTAYLFRRKMPKTESLHFGLGSKLITSS